MIKNQKNSTALRLSGSTASKGFTLVELLVVIGIIAILFAVVLVAINPAKRFAESSNARRLADVNSILGAITTSTVDLKGTLPSGLTMGSSTAITPSAIKPRFIGTGTTNISTAIDPKFTANACYGVSTCAATGFACSSDNDCPYVAAITGTTVPSTNVCNTTTSRCVLSGRYCTANTDCWTTDSSPVYDNVCVYSGASARLTATTQTGTCLITLNACSGSTSSADCPTMNGASNACKANQIGHIRPYDLSASGEGLVPAYIGAMPKDPSGTGFMGTGPTLGDTQTGYAVFNVPSTVASYAAGITGSAASGGAVIVTSATTAVSEPQIGYKVQIGSDVQIRTVLSKAVVAGFMNITVDSNYTVNISSAAITVIPSSGVATATNRIKVVACNPNDSDSDGDYKNNKIEVLR